MIQLGAWRPVIGHVQALRARKTGSLKHFNQPESTDNSEQIFPDLDGRNYSS